ncbi:hypothetical protein WMF28_09000 [Sorangium sp. So ce590]|uniref:hypothetical protein n=1 Tax=Sorangium sp. So ce590 TaxID=3133317 RepID=UPI003F5E963D
MAHGDEADSRVGSQLTAVGEQREPTESRQVQALVLGGFAVHHQVAIPDLNVQLHFRGVVARAIGNEIDGHAADLAARVFHSADEDSAIPILCIVAIGEQTQAREAEGSDSNETTRRPYPSGSRDPTLVHRRSLYQGSARAPDSHCPGETPWGS